MRRHHRREAEVWLVFEKKALRRGGLDLDAAIEEALCWGWIDSVLRRIDERSHMIRFSPRRPDSQWSLSNQQRVERLTRQRRMTRAGLATVELAKRNGRWDQLAELEREQTVPDDLAVALRRDRPAAQRFAVLPPSHQKRYLWWIASAKRAETRARRVGETVRRLHDEATTP